MSFFKDALANCLCIKYDAIRFSMITEIPRIKLTILIKLLSILKHLKFTLQIIYVYNCALFVMQLFKLMCMKKIKIQRCMYIFHKLQVNIFIQGVATLRQNIL